MLRDRSLSRQPTDEMVAPILLAVPLLTALLPAALGAAGPADERRHHAAGAERQAAGGAGRATVDPDEVLPAFWYEEAARGIEARVRRRGPTPGAATNVVMFLGDGMSVPTLAAARTLLGQRRGRTGEEAELSFETFPTVGLAKTYCVDAQVADSACSASAYLCGAKANLGTVGVAATVARGECGAATVAAHRLRSLADWALEDGRDAGLVTTTRVTHASPAGVYAHSADRDWESDADVRRECGDGEHVQPDIALQLVRGRTGGRLKVVLGGGRREFRPREAVDEEGVAGRREDGRDLIDEWRALRAARNESHAYVWNREQLRAVTALGADAPDYLLGLFEGSHMQYAALADEATEPTLADLTETAIRSLARNERGFFLFVEGGRIDHAHHENLARLALDETLQFDEAVRRARSLLDERDGLIVVTADHAHAMTFNGYAARGADVLGPSDDADAAGVPYSTLTYANGPGFRAHEDGRRRDVTREDDGSALFPYEAGAPLDSETHGGDDVAVFALGPHHDMFTGLYEQSRLPHLMAYAACLGPGPHACDEAAPDAR